MRPKPEMVRVVRQPDGHVAVDAGGKVSGRGAYLCRSIDCVSLAKKRRILERNLGIDDCGALYDSLMEVCAEDTHLQ